MIASRDMKAGLSHQGKQAHRFQGYGFATGVRACDYQKVKIISQPDVDRNHLFFVYQRVACFFQLNFSICVKLRFRGIVLQCQAGSGKDEIQFYQNIQVVC